MSNPTLAVDFDNLGAPSAMDGDSASVELRYSQDVSLNNKHELRLTLAQAEQLNTQLAIQKRRAALSADVRLCLARWTMADARLACQKDEQSIAQAQARVLSERLASCGCMASRASTQTIQYKTDVLRNLASFISYLSDK